MVISAANAASSPRVMTPPISLRCSAQRSEGEGRISVGEPLLYVIDISDFLPRCILKTYLSILSYGCFFRGDALGYPLGTAFITPRGNNDVTKRKKFTA